MKQQVNMWKTCEQPSVQHGGFRLVKLLSKSELRFQASFVHKIIHRTWSFKSAVYPQPFFFFCLVITICCNGYPGFE